MRHRIPAPRASVLALGVFSFALALAVRAPGAGDRAPAPVGSLGDPLAWERAAAEHDPRFQPRVARGVPHLGGAEVGPRGARIPSAGVLVSFRLAALGRAEAMRSTLDAEPSVHGAEVRLARAPGVVEWWRSLPSGLEQGVTLEGPPSGRGPLLLEMSAGPDVSPQRVDDDEVALRARDGRVVARYARLTVLDARGVRAPARLDVRGGRIVIEVDDRTARYPLVIDPLFVREEATLERVDAPPFDDELGRHVALSGDGRIALASVQGGLRAFARGAGDVWAQEASIALSGAAIVYGVALSGAGDRALVGAAWNDTAAGVQAGTAFVYARSAPGTWTLEATLVASDAAPYDQFGTSVALSSDGTLALVGVPQDDRAAGPNAGSARVFARGAGGTWTEEAALALGDGVGGDQAAIAVALSGDGRRALVGVPGDDTASLGVDSGSVRVYTRTAPGAWAEEAMLTGPMRIASSRPDFGIALALSADGGRALVGAPRDDVDGRVDCGSAWVYTRTSAGAWTSEARLVAASSGADDRFGDAVALSADGMRALVGASRDSTARGGESGSARVLVRALSAAWTEEAMLLAADGDAGDWLGRSVALAADGSRALVGVPLDDTAFGLIAGSARVFVLAPLLGDGGACAVAAECSSGFCVDGVCCATACGGGSDGDCQACASARTGMPSGTCAPATSGSVCRAAADDCDVAETCDGVGTSCPLDALAPSTVVCRPAVGACDADERCTGAAVACPADGLAPAGAVCRPATSGGCDVAEVCSGAARTCPGDAVSAPGVVCRGAAGVCDVPEACDGSGPNCPADAVAPATTVCRGSAGPCDVVEACDGAGAACPADVFADASVECDGRIADECDAPDHCTGASAACPDAFLAGVECRPALGSCDVAEVCAGTSASCPPDGLVGAGVVCRAATDPVCDAEESCDGASTSCPADETTCVIVDGGAPDAGLADGSATAPDAGGVAAVSGCACHAAGRARRTVLGPLALGLLVGGAIRRRRRG